MSSPRETCLTCVPSRRALIDNTKPGDTTTVNEDPNSPVEVLRLVPEEFLLEHLTERYVYDYAGGVCGRLDKR